LVATSSAVNCVTADGKVDAGTKVQKPGVVTFREQVFEQVRFDGVDGKNRARDAKPVNQYDRAFSTTLTPRQSQFDTIACLEKMHFRRGDPERALFSRWSIGIETRRLRKNPTIRIEKHASEKPSEAGFCFEPFECIRRAIVVS